MLRNRQNVQKKKNVKKSSKNLQKCGETVKKPSKIIQKFQKTVKKQYTYPKTINNIGKPQKN